MRVWYYVVGGEKRGPVPEEELVFLFKTGALPSDTLVWTEGMEEWAVANSVESLSRAAFGISPKNETKGIASTNIATGLKKSVKPADPAPIKMDKPSFDVGGLHFSCDDRTDTSWFLGFGHSPVPGMMYSKGFAVLHYPCRGYHKARIDLWSHSSAHDEVFPKKESARKQFFEDLFRAFGIPLDTPWSARWHYGGECAVSISGPDPNVRICI